MNKAILEQLEFEKNKREIIRSAGQTKENFSSPELSKEPDQKYAWEYELERYRKEKTMNRFNFIGAICGILSLIITVWFHFYDILAMF